MPRKQIVITINRQTTEAEQLKIFKAMPDVDKIKEVGVHWGGTWSRRHYELDEKLKPRTK